MKLPSSSVSAETEIAKLLYRYAECMDNGDFAGAATLFEHARLRVAPGPDGMIGAVSHHLNRPIAKIGGTA
jgi:hypothetical protein